jgi:hypothetical protein
VTDDNAPNAIDVSGALVWYLHYTGGIAPSVMNISPMGLTSNVAIPIISPGGNESQFTPVAFEDSGAMYMSMYNDDRVVPPKFLQESLKVENCESPSSLVLGGCPLTLCRVCVRD